MSKLSPDENTLVECAIAGDADAFGELYLLHLDAIFRYIFFRVGEAAEAEDLTEQVFLKAWEALSSYQRRGNPFTSWLYRIAHNIVVDYHRRVRPVISVTLLNDDDLKSEQASALSQVIAYEESSSLAKAISQLPDDQQQVIILRFIEGLSHSEISRIMDKTEGACRMLQHRALTALDKLLRCTQETSQSPSV